VRALLRVAARDVGWNADLPPLGAMIETPHAAGTARDIALEADFLSLGTNDLVQYTLNLDRTEPLATARSAAHPEVLELIAGTVAAAHMAGLTVEICGESASVPELAALYVGLGVDELSVAPARLDELRAVVRGVVASEAEDVAQRALEAESASAVLAMAARLLRESGDEQREVLGGLGGVVA
jgi:phosphoenolpyruvate-protein kinase (PTS system EI component)